MTQNRTKENDNAETLYEDELDQVCKTLSSDLSGLSQQEAVDRQKTYGLNKLERLKKPIILLTFLSNFTHMMALLLWAGGAIALFAGMKQLAIAIWLVNVINGVFSFWQEFKAERATEALLSLVPKQARVMRNGSEQNIAAEELVPGDIIIIEEGDDIAADARVIEDKGLFVDQSLLTGESAPVRKTTSDDSRYHHPNRGHADIVYAGTSVTAGQARALVISTGMRSRFGKIAHLTQRIRAEDSPLQKEMVRVTRTVTFLAVSVGVSFFLIAVLLLDVNATDSFIFALGMIVAFVPEGMLPTVSLSLAIAVQQMAARNAIVRRLSSVETLGCTTVICSDKTGTLTRNEMLVTNAWCFDTAVEISGTGYEPVGVLRNSDDAISFESIPPALESLFEAGARCCNAKLIQPDEESSRWRITGDPTEAAILVAHSKIESLLDRDEHATINRQNEVTSFRVDCIAFDPHRKRMSTLWKENEDYVSYVKGAPREILELSVSKLEGNQESAIDDSTRRCIKEEIDKYARRGLRVIGVGRRTFNEKPPMEEELLERNLTFLGLIAMIDPLHEEVPDALARCQKAGIHVIMITGDYELTAVSIARQAGIINSENARVVTGKELAVLDDSQLAEALQGEVIFARTSPEDKLRIVRALQKLDHIVAVTGDGVNDAPALKQADIGIAMGKSGTDVARESADIVLSDDNFASIVAAVELGRSVYDNIRKFSVYVFASNVAEAVPFACLLFSRGLIPLPITLMQVLLIDLGTDMVPAIGLGADQPDPDVMNKPPRNPSDRLLSRQLLAKVFFWYGAIEAVAAMSAYFFVNWLNGWPAHSLAASNTEVYRIATTAALSAVVVCQIGTVLCCRSNNTSIFAKSLFTNKLLLSGIAFELMLLISVMMLPPLKAIFGTEQLSIEASIFVLMWLPLFVMLDEARKLFLRNRVKAIKGNR